MKYGGKYKTQHMICTYNLHRQTILSYINKYLTSLHTIDNLKWQPLFDKRIVRQLSFFNCDSDKQLTVKCRITIKGTFF